MESINRNKLFIASCLALTVTSMTFAIRAGMLGPLGIEFELDNKQIGIIASTAFWGFPLAVIIGGMVTDIIGMRNLMILAFVSHVVGIVMTIFAGGFWGLFFSTLLIGVANGLVEAACNPLVATLYPENKTTKLNHFHLWFPGGLVIGGLVVYFFGADFINLGWQWQMATMLLPAVIYGIMFFGEKFPVTERVAKGVSTSEMYSSMLTPLFLFMIVCMFCTSITELGTNQWIAVILDNVSDNPILLLVFVSSIMVIGRAFAGPVVHGFSPPGVLLVSAILSTIGLYWMSVAEGNMIFVATAVFAMGVTYFWPTMIGFIAEYIPKSGAVGLGIIGGAGMFATAIFQPIIGGVYDAQLVEALPTGSDLAMYKAAAAETAEAMEYAKAQVKAGPYILKSMMVLPLFLIFAFGALYFMRDKLPKSHEAI